MLTSRDSPYGYGKLLLDITTTTLTRAKMRWRMAYATIYAVRAMLSLPKELLNKKNNYKKDSEILHSYSYTALDVKPSTSNQEISTETDRCSFLPNTVFDHAGLVRVVKDKDLGALNQFGGVIGVSTYLKTNPDNGIPGNELEVNERREIFGSNTYHKQPPKGLFYFVLDASKDTTILILCVCAALSLGFGIKEHGAKEGWYEGGSIFVAVFIVIVVSALSNFRQELQFDKLSKISSNIKVEVFRDKQRQEISIFDIVVGDVVVLNMGDQIPADGLFLDGYSLQVDESSMTGESDHVEVDSTKNPFLFSGAKVVDGHARMLVTSVGMNTAWGEMMSSISQDSNERTPLQERLDKLTSSIGKVGLAVAFLVLVVLLIRYFTGNTKDDYGRKEYSGSNKSIDSVLSGVVRIVSAAVTIVVVAIPEGLPLAVTLTLAYSMKRMMNDQAMVRKLQACETMGSATVICTDKTGTLTKNEMEVTQFFVGQDLIEKDNSITSIVRELFHQGVGLNTTGSVYMPLLGSKPEISGSPTEKAILHWAVSDLGMDMEKLKPSYDILHVEMFNSDKKRSGVLIKKKNNTIHVHWKGAAEMIVAMCSSYYETNGTIKSLDEDGRSNIEKTIQGMAASSLRCIAFAHAQISEKEIEYSNDNKAHPRLKEDGLILLGVVGLKDPCRPGVTKAVRICMSAGVQIKMITGDNVFTAKAIATECGILKTEDVENGDQVIEGAEFRNYTPEERMKRVDRICVMARSSPFDKLLMVQCLKQKGHVVAVTGDGTNDAPALKEADIGLSMGIQGTEVAKESSDIIILDDNFNSVATVLRWGRCVYNNIQKFIQFQLTVNVAALVINFIAAVSAGEVPLTAVQLLWVNLIMDTLGALALATERPTDELMQKKPVGRTAPLITNIMWRNLLCQALYQIAILLTLQFSGESIFNVTAAVNDTLIFNTFVLCQIFNEFNSRSMEKQNVFKGIHRNKLFIGIVVITIVLQVVMVEFLKKFAPEVSGASPPSSIPFLPDNSPPQESDGNGGKSGKARGLSKTAVIAITVSDVIGICLVGLLFSYCYSRFWARSKVKDENGFGKGGKGKKECLCFRRDESETLSENMEQYDLVALDTQVAFDLDELLKASAFVLGKSGIGIVYKVVLEEGITLAVRRLGEGGSQRFKEFQTEVEAIGKLRHPNVVTLKAYYWSVDEKLLIYDYIPNGSLSTALHGKPGLVSFTPLSWSVRLNIMKGIAKGLVYLHEFSPKKYVHGDLKPNNILLGQNMEPRISDFGLGRLANIAGGSPTLQSNRIPTEKSQERQQKSAAPSEASVVSSSINLGSCYQAPESLKVVKPSQKWDVYSYGVILLEMITGRLPIVQVGSSEMDLVQWIQLNIEEKKPLLDVLDPNLMHDVDKEEEIIAVLKIAMACVHSSPERRPIMRHISDALDRLATSAV